MLQFLKKISWILLLAAGLQTSWAFSLLGPNASGLIIDYTPGTLPAGFGDDWQVSVIGYGFIGSADLGGPKNLGEAYRRNAQVYYYAYDANYLNFFGSNGVVAVDQAFTIMNNVLTNVDAFSAALTEFPLNSQAINFDASALGLVDVKSLTLGALVEQMGLADPVRYAWTLHDRKLPGGAQCPGYEYWVVQRNYDITASPLSQLQYSPYVNGTLYSYYLLEECAVMPAVPDPQAVTIPEQVDPLQNIFAPVASMNNVIPVILGGQQINVGIQIGGFYTGLTRDDAAGLRYLYSTNNIAFESPATGSVLVNSSGPGGTNYGAPFVLFTSNYTAFALSALTNDPVTLSNLFPGLIITSSSASFSVINTTNYIAYFTNLIGAPAGSQTLVIAPVVTPVLVTTYADTFANVIIPTGSKTNKNSSGLLLTTQVQQLNGAPAGTLVTNTTTKKVTLNGVPSGDYYINTNVCGPNLILSTLYTNIVATTNLIVTASNTAGLFYSQSLVTYETNHWYVAEPILCGAVAGGTSTNAPGLFQGVGNVQFVQTTYDSLLGQFYQPITNTYSQVVIVNSKRVNQTFQRVVTVPDILVTADDFTTGPNDNPGFNSNPFARSINFNIANIAHNLAGPGTIDQPSVITFNKAGTVYLNGAGGNQASGPLFMELGSFDGSTNAPVVYPDGTSIDNLANQILVQISPSALPDGTNGVVYPTTTFVATGGAFSPPFTWSLPNGGLPSGLTLSLGGTISGTPTQSGTFDFTVQLTDALSRTVTWSYSLTIH